MAQFVFNCTSSNNNNTNYLITAELIANQLFLWQRTSMTVVFCALVAVSFVGNFISLTLLYSRTYHTLYKCCLFSQCVSDLLIAGVVGSDQLLKLSSDVTEWRMGTIGCKLVPFFGNVGILSSSFTLTCIAIDRMLSILRAQNHYHPNIYFSALIILSIWIVACGISVPMLYAYENSMFCQIEISCSSVVTCSKCPYLCLSTGYPLVMTYQYYVALFCIIFLPVLVTFIMSYSVLGHYIWNKRKHLNDRETSTVTTNIEGTEASTSAQTQVKLIGLQKRKDHTHTLISIILISFILCRLPAWIFNLVSLNPEVNLKDNASIFLKTILSALTVLNTAINPFIYSLVQIKKFLCFK